MGIYRGPGGTGDATSDAELNALTVLSTAASNSAAEAAISATAAAASASSASTSASTASTAVAGIGTSVTDAQTAAITATTKATEAAASAADAAASASSINPSSFATAAQGAKADTAVQPAAITNMLETSDIGVSVQAYNANTAVKNTAQTYTAAQRSSTVSLTDGTTITPDFSLANTFNVQLGGNRTLGVPTNVVADQTGSITVYQDKTGSRTLAYAWPYVWSSGSAGTLSTAGASEDQLVYQVSVNTAATVTMTIATPCVVTMTGHGFKHGQRCQIATTGALPTGLAVSTTYFIEVIDANSFYLCTSRANVAAGTRIATSGSQSGTHTLTGMTIRLALNKAFA